MNKTVFSRFTLYWGPVLLYAGLIFWLSSLSTVPRVPEFSDKILHAIEYSCLALLLWRAFAREHFRILEHRRVIAVIWIACAYGASDEIHQNFVPGRHASIYDWAADVAGILGMITLVLSRVKWRGKAGKYNYETI